MAPGPQAGSHTTPSLSPSTASKARTAHGGVSYSCSLWVPSQWRWEFAEIAPPAKTSVARQAARSIGSARGFAIDVQPSTFLSTI
jgi:hypothetical protein